MKHKKIPTNIKKAVLDRYDGRCVWCGSTEDLEFHHAIPLEIGGPDTVYNLMPLCYDCHKSMTHYELRMLKVGRVHKAGGRKRIIPDNYKDILWRYVRCEIGKQECVRELGLSEKNKLTDNVFYKEFLKENGIESQRNNIDIRISNNGIQYGDYVGYIKYTDGREEKIAWCGDAMQGNRSGKPIILFKKYKEMMGIC